MKMNLFKQFRSGQKLQFMGSAKRKRWESQNRLTRFKESSHAFFNSVKLALFTLTVSRSSGGTTTLRGPTGLSSLAPTGELSEGLGDLSALLPWPFLLSFVFITAGDFFGVRAMRYGGWEDYNQVSHATCRPCVTREKQRLVSVRLLLQAPLRLPKPPYCGAEKSEE